MALPVDGIKLHRGNFVVIGKHIHSHYWMPGNASACM